VSALVIVQAGDAVDPSAAFGGTSTQLGEALDRARSNGDRST